MMGIKSFAVAAAALTALVSTSVGAVPQKRQFTFTGSDYSTLTFGDGSATPLANTVDLKFTLALDPSLSPIGPTNTGLHIAQFNLPYSMSYIFNGGYLIIGTNPVFGPMGPTCTMTNGAFCLFVTDAFGTSPSASSSSQAPDVYTKGVWRAKSLSLSYVDRAPIQGSVPEPATWAMMLGGFLLVGSALRLRRPLPATRAS